ncbi:hypothetical protein [Crossiella cryophila]|uniref:Uncharacterized protein n=1 Tax=Crossiella cryophila TaxID=43355 RepID=A0A7W7CIJ5_9PSEU|nr:hypothetical protein [Crossiella cryophila]MBB4680388.1 hypothetical protein [Crossiella cryophila]
MARHTATGFALAGAGVVPGLLLATLDGTLWHGPDPDTAQKLSATLGEPGGGKSTLALL